MTSGALIRLMKYGQLQLTIWSSAPTNLFDKNDGGASGAIRLSEGIMAREKVLLGDEIDTLAERLTQLSNDNERLNRKCVRFSRFLGKFIFKILRRQRKGRLRDGRPPPPVQRAGRVRQESLHVHAPQGHGRRTRRVGECGVLLISRFHSSMSLPTPPRCTPRRRSPRSRRRPPTLCRARRRRSPTTRSRLR